MGISIGLRDVAPFFSLYFFVQLIGSVFYVKWSPVFGPNGARRYWITVGYFFGISVLSVVVVVLIVGIFA